MSSHHFVKEGQEPALIIVEPLPFKVVQPLLEWAPLVIVFEEAIDSVLSWGIKADVILSGGILPDELMQKAAHQQPFEMIASSKSQMFDDAIQFAVAKNQLFVTVAVAGAAAYFQRCTALAKKVDISIIDTVARWSSIHSGIFTKWFGASAILHLNNSGDFKISGAVQQNGSNTYQVLVDSIITVQSDSFFWIGEPLN
jgi:hypothetical protein